MQEELKLQIIAGAKDYAEQKKLSNADVADMSGVNEGYISLMLRNTLVTKVAGKVVPIGDKWFHKLAEWAGFSLTKPHWETVATPQFLMTLHLLEQAKKKQKVTTIINDSGFGKSYSTNKFCLKHPAFTYKIVASKEHKLPDILREMCAKIGIVGGGSNAHKIGLLAYRLKELKRSGHNPVIIIDEAENMDMRALQMMKSLYDNIHTFSGLVFIGTSQLTRSLLRLKNRDRQGMPQFYRRIKVGIREIDPVPDFKVFYDKYSIPVNLRKLLSGLCDNYGELHDYLEPVLMEADERQEKITEDLFRLVHDMPKF